MLYDKIEYKELIWCLECLVKVNLISILHKQKIEEDVS